MPVIRENLESGGEIERSAAVVASWVRYAEGEDEQGEAIEVVDQRKDQLMELAARARDGDPDAFIRNRDLFGDLADSERFMDAYRRCVRLAARARRPRTLDALAEGV